MSATEYILLVNEENQEIGLEEKLTAHRLNLLHRAFSVFIFRKNSHNELELLLQQRAMTKYHSPGLWTNTCCSHPHAKETIIVAGKRRLKEEFGFEAELHDLGWFHYNVHFENGLSENEIDHVLVGKIAEDQQILPNPQEIHDYKWMPLTELKSDLDRNAQNYTHWLKAALNIVIMKWLSRNCETFTE